MAIALPFPFRLDATMCLVIVAVLGAGPIGNQVFPIPDTTMLPWVGVLPASQSRNDPSQLWRAHRCHDNSYLLDGRWFETPVASVIVIVALVVAMTAIMRLYGKPIVPEIHH